MPSLIAHRGFPERYPENTLVGIEAAIDAGARYVEVDVQLSADSVPVVFHDDGLQRLCGIPGRITDYAMEEIRRLRVDGEPVPPLSDLVACLQRYPAVHAFVELKQESINGIGEASLLAAVVAVLAPARSQCTLISFNAAIIRLAMTQGWSSGWVTEVWPKAFPDELEQGLDIWFCDVMALPDGLRLDRLRVPLAVYEVSDPAMARSLAGRGAAYIETNDIAGMRQGLVSWT